MSDDRRLKAMARLRDAVEAMQDALLELDASPATSIFIGHKNADALLVAYRSDMAYANPARGHRTPDFILEVAGVPFYSDRPRRG
jgi:PAS domain-containing protein